MPSTVQIITTNYIPHATYKDHKLEMLTIPGGKRDMYPVVH